MISQRHFKKIIKNSCKEVNTKKFFNLFLKECLNNVKNQNTPSKWTMIYFGYDPKHPEYLVYENSMVSYNFNLAYINKYFTKEKIEKELTKRKFSFDWKRERNDMYLKIYFTK